MKKKLFLFAFLLICANGVNYELYYEVQTEFGVMKLKMLKPTEK